MAGRTSSIEIDDLTLAYDRRPAVHHLSGRFEAGSLTAVVGPNGAGKSTLLKAIAGLLRPEAGRIALGLWRRLGVFRGLDPAMAGRVDGALAAVGLAGLGDTAIGSLSVGQLQRVLFARLSLQEARAILLDEPFAAVDQRTTGDLLAL